MLLIYFKENICMGMKKQMIMTRDMYALLLNCFRYNNEPICNSK
jgi:hypothetical protein